MDAVRVFYTRIGGQVTSTRILTQDLPSHTLAELHGSLMDRLNNRA